MAKHKKCNMCGKDLDKSFDTYIDYVLYAYIGYGSIHDGDKVNMRLCSNCLDNLIAACKINPVEEL